VRNKSKLRRLILPDIQDQTDVADFRVCSGYISLLTSKFQMAKRTVSFFFGRAPNQNSK
jgi:hypothetical protein